MTRQKPLIMGVLNVTPDSFSDGGRYLDEAEALRHAETLLSEGADILDIGAESTRPGAQPVAEQEEWRRLEPVLTAVLERFPEALVSLDTRKPAIMLKGAEHGCRMINDISGVADDETLAFLARREGLSYLAMHMHGEPQTMQTSPLDGAHAVEAVDRAFSEWEKRLLAAGFSKERIWLDPGIGFGKTDRGNVQLMAALPRWASRYNVAIGISRKSLLGRTLGIERPEERDHASKGLELGLAVAGAGLIRTHAVAPLRRLIDLLD